MNSAKARVILTADGYVRGGEKGSLKTNVEQALEAILKEREQAEKRTKLKNVQDHTKSQPFVVFIANRMGPEVSITEIAGVQEKFLEEVNFIYHTVKTCMATWPQNLYAHHNFGFFYHACMHVYRRWRTENLSVILFPWTVKVHSSLCTRQEQLVSSLVLSIPQLATCFMLHFHTR